MHKKIKHYIDYPLKLWSVTNNIIHIESSGTKEYQNKIKCTWKMQKNEVFIIYDFSFQV